MSPTVDGVPAHEAMGSAYCHGALSSKSLLCATALGFKHIIQVMGLLKLPPEAALRLYSIATRVTIHLSLCAVVTLASPNRQRLMDVITHAHPLNIGTYPSDTAIHPVQARLIPHHTPRCRPPVWSSRLASKQGGGKRRTRSTEVRAWYSSTSEGPAFSARNH
jgi:hypothetical protein